MAPHSSTTARDRAIQFYDSIAPGSADPGEATEAYKDVDELACLLYRVPAFTSRPVRTVAVGAGFSGFALARAIHVGKLPNASVTVYKKTGGIGGTWYENRYPGCACVIPAPNYTVGEIVHLQHPQGMAITSSHGHPTLLGPRTTPKHQKYIDRLADQHGLRQYIETSRKVTHYEWIEDRQVCKISGIKIDGRDLVISSPGVSEGEIETTFEG